MEPKWYIIGVEARSLTQEQDKSPYSSKNTFTPLKWAVILGLLFIIFVLVVLGIILLVNTGY